MHRACLALVACLAASASAADPPPGRIVNVATDAALSKALADARPGDAIRLATGRYRGVWRSGLTGTADRPIVIESADPGKPAEFVGGGEGLHLTDPAHVVLRNLVVRGQTGNGLNIDDGGSYDTPAHHVRIEGVGVRDIGPTGNHDGIKLSGVDDFEIRGCTIEGWAGSAIDMVGCHRGLIVGCTFRGKEGFSQNTGPQTKGGSREVVIRNCTFRDAGQRAVNIGGSTGLPYFRPADAGYEAKDITVEGCTFSGSMAPVAFVGADGAVVRYNTIYRPTRWAARILQETVGERFVACRNGVFEHNVVVFRRGDLTPAVNVGPNTAPGTFTFRNNVWFCIDAPPASRQALPVAETGSLYGQDPKLKDPAKGELTITDAKIAHLAGPAALPPPAPPTTQPEPKGPGNAPLPGADEPAAPGARASPPQRVNPSRPGT